MVLIATADSLFWIAIQNVIKMIYKVIALNRWNKVEHKATSVRNNNLQVFRKRLLWKIKKKDITGTHFRPSFYALNPTGKWPTSLSKRRLRNRSFPMSFTKLSKKLFCRIILCHCFWLSHFRPMFPFYTAWKRQKTFWFSDVFRGYRKGTLAWNGLIKLL